MRAVAGKGIVAAGSRHTARAALTTLDLMKEESIDNPFEDELREWAKEIVESIASSIEVVS